MEGDWCINTQATNEVQRHHGVTKIIVTVTEFCNF